MNAGLDAGRLAAARLWASAQAPYLASALFASPVSAAPGSATIAIDTGWRIHADPAVLAGMEVADLGRLLIHLSGHLVRDHADRARTLGVAAADARVRWNRAADAEINDDLHADRLVPACAPDRPRDLGCPDGRLAEAYHAQAREGPRRWDCGSGADGAPRAGEDGAGGIDPRQGQMLRLRVAADIHGRPPGTVPGGWRRWAESVLPSRTDWRRALAAEIRRAVAITAGAIDYSHARRSRRAEVSPDVIVPALVRPVPKVAIVCDTSGSMHARLLERALTEVDAILTRVGLRTGRVPVLAVDTAVHAVRRVTRARQVQLSGGGGTDMGRGIAAAAALRPRPSVVVVLTDGFTPWPAAPPRGIRVVVGVLAESGAAPAGPAWARTVMIDDSGAG